LRNQKNSTVVYNSLGTVPEGPYGTTCYCGISIWLNGSNHYYDIRGVNALHYRSLRIAAKDFKKKPWLLDLLGRASYSTDKVSDILNE